MFDLFYKLVNYSSIAKWFRSYQGDYIILMYHRVLEDNADDFFDFPNKGIAVTRSQFDDHMLFLKQSQYEIVTIDEVLKANLTGKPKIIITFDDGYRDNFELAFPILKKYNIPATIYITTSFIDGPKVLWWYYLWDLCQSKSSIILNLDKEKKIFKLNTKKEKIKVYQELCRYFRKINIDEQISLMDQLSGDFTVEKYNLFMDWNQLRIISNDPLITIGAHAINHLSLANLTSEDSRNEISKSKTILETNLKKTVEHFAFPFGRNSDVSERELDFVKSTGYKTAVTTECEIMNMNNLFSIPRQAIYKRHNINAILCKISGINNFLKRHI